MHIDEGQELAMHTVEGQVVIVACPGSGKTTTLLNRLNYMTDELKISPESILVVAFSKAAATEMKTRYEAKYNAKSNVFIGTLHSFCLALIRKFHPESLRNGVISDKEVIDMFMRKIRDKQNVGNKMEFINDLRLDIGKIKNSYQTLGEFTPSCCRSKEMFAELYRAYEDYKEYNNQIDYDDMLIIANDILVNDKDALSWIRGRYKYVLVDEYQDINVIQRDILYQIAGEKGNLAVVGDDDQAIYGFRGAESSIMLNFQNDYPAATVIHLETNYRSNSEIVNKAAKLIQNNKERFDKKVSAFRGTGGSVQLLGYDNREDEVEWLVKEIKKRISEGCSPEEIAVLYRVNKQGIVLADKLRDNCIEFRTNERIGGIFDHWIYSDILAFVRMAQGNGTRDDLTRTLNHPNRYLHDDDIRRKGLDKQYMIDTIKNKNYEDWRIDSAIGQVNEYFMLLDLLKNASTPEDFIKKLIKHGRYKTYLSEYAEYRNEDVSDLVMILDQLEKAASGCSTWEDMDGLAVNERRELEATQNSTKGIMLSTIHGAKGLEWQEVFIIDCVEGKYPYIKSTSAKELEEERRLFYVGMTRAKNRLVMLFSRKEDERKLKESRYLREAGMVIPSASESASSSLDSRIGGQGAGRGQFDRNASKRGKMAVQVRQSAPPAAKEVPEISEGDKVKAMLYGDGVIKSIEVGSSGKPRKFVVRFVADGEKSYTYPSAFEKGIVHKK